MASDIQSLNVQSSYFVPHRNWGLVFKCLCGVRIDFKLSKIQKVSRPWAIPVMSSKVTNVDMYSSDPRHIHVNLTRFLNSARQGDQGMCELDFFDRC
jgi:hypothetical protein